MAQQRIYLVKDSSGAARMVRAGSKAAAIGHCARRDYSATVASQQEIVDFFTENMEANGQANRGSSGICIEDATRADKEDAE